MRNTLKSFAPWLAIVSTMMLCACQPIAPLRTEVARTATYQEAAVVQAAALDFLASGQCFESGGKQGIMVATTTSDTLASLSNEWLRYNLPADIWTDAEPLLDSFRLENTKIFLMDWRFSSDDIVIGDTRKADYISIRTDKHAKCIAWFGVPTFAKGGDSALVIFDVGPEDHGRTVLYVMRRSGNEWIQTKGHVFEFL